ncbi:MAG: alpha/beta hydrolase, partial [Henriciella sp.]
EVTDPTLTLFRAKAPAGKTMLIIPGGGYKWVVVEKEGYEGARYFNQFGYDVYVMDYRLPHQGWAAGPDTPLQDAQRAMRVIRSRAETDGIDPDNILVMGFSAGGHLAGSLCQRFDAPVYDAVDEADALSARPDLGVLVYPVALMRAPLAHEGSRTCLIGEAPSDALYAKYDLTSAPHPAGPPLFLLHALDDEAVPVENSLFMATACRKAGVSAVLHTFEKGGHGFGLRGIGDMPVGVWPQLVMDWAEARAASAR